MDYLIVGAVVGGALVYALWNFKKKVSKKTQGPGGCSCTGGACNSCPVVQLKVKKS